MNNELKFKRKFYKTLFNHFEYDKNDPEQFEEIGKYFLEESMDILYHYVTMPDYKNNIFALAKELERYDWHGDGDLYNLCKKALKIWAKINENNN